MNERMTNFHYEIAADCRDMAEVKCLVEHLDTTFDAEGELLFFGSRNVIKRYRLGDAAFLMGKGVVVKRFGSKNFFQQLAYSCGGQSKARRAFCNGQKLLEIGCDTPFPVAYAERRRGMWLECCYYISAFTDAVSVRQALEVEFNRSLAQAFARFIARLHEAGVVHHDLNFSNVLYRQQGSAYAISVIDINRMTISHPASLSLKDCKDDFVRWTDRWDLFEFVMREYAQARGLDVNSFVQEAFSMKRQHNKAWRRRKGFTRKLKNFANKFISFRVCHSD